MASPPFDRKFRDTANVPVRLDEIAQVGELGDVYLERESRQRTERDKFRTEAGDTITRPEARRRIATQQALVRLSEGDHVRDIAEDIGVSLHTLTGWIARYKHRLKEAEIDERLDKIALPLATDNLIHGLIAGDKDYTLETLRGRGKLRRYTNADETVHHDLPELKISFEMPNASVGMAPEHIAMGKVVGRAALPAPATAGEKVHADVLAAEFEVEEIQRAHKSREDDETRD